MPLFQDLMEKTREEFKGQVDNSPIAPALRLSDIPSSLCIIDTVERLGIDRYFRSDIDNVLEHTYRLIVKIYYSFPFLSFSLCTRVKCSRCIYLYDEICAN